MDERTEQFWQAYLATLSEGQRPTAYRAESWGDNPQLDDELAALIVAGKKTATCSALWEWEVEGEPIPQVGLKTILLSSAGEPLAALETTEVTIRAY